MSEGIAAMNMERPEQQSIEAASAARPQAPAPRWPVKSWQRIVHGVALALALRASMLATFMAGGALLGLSRDLEQVDGRAFLMLAVVSLIGIGGIVYAGLFRAGRVGFNELGIRREHFGREVALGVLGFVLVCLALLGTVNLFHQNVPLGEAWSTIAGYSPAHRLLFLGIGIEAAITEETIFRGYLQPALIARFGLVLGIFIGAAFFALYHLNMRPSALLGKLLIGLILGALRGKDRSLVAPAVTHALIWAVLGTL